MTKTLYILLAIILIANVAFLNWQFLERSKTAEENAKKETALIEEKLLTLEEKLQSPTLSHKSGIRRPQIQQEEYSQPQQQIADTSQLPVNETLDPLKTTKRLIEYSYKGETFWGYWRKAECADIVADPRPVPTIILIHNRVGIDNMHHKVARTISSEKCYNTFIANLYGTENAESLTQKPDLLNDLYKQLTSEPQQTIQKIGAALEWVKKRDDVDPDNIALIGFISGGNFATWAGLDGMDLKAVVGFHARLDRMSTIKNPLPKDGSSVKAKIQLHVSERHIKESGWDLKGWLKSVEDANLPVTTYVYKTRNKFFATAGLSFDNKTDKDAKELVWQRTFDLIDGEFEKDEQEQGTL